jgi:hypothetical protein
VSGMCRLGQEYDGVIQPVRFTGRVLNDSEGGTISLRKRRSPS